MLPVSYMTRAQLGDRESGMTSEHVCERAQISLCNGGRALTYFAVAMVAKVSTAVKTRKASAANAV